MALNWLYEKPSCTTCDSADNCFTRLTSHCPPDYSCYIPNERAQAWHDADKPAPEKLKPDYIIHDLDCETARWYCDTVDDLHPPKCSCERIK